jgi:hypothetical protein
MGSIYVSGLLRSAVKADDVCVLSINVMCIATNI